MRFSLILSFIPFLFLAANYAEANGCKSQRVLGTGTVADYIRNEANQIQQESMLRDVETRANSLRSYASSICIVLASDFDANLTRAVATGLFQEGNYQYRRFLAQSKYTNASELREKAIALLLRSQKIAKLSGLSPSPAQLISNLSKAPVGPLIHQDAKTCGFVDIRSSFGPIRNQDNLGNCHANVAADIAGFYLPGHPYVSAMDITLIGDRFKDPNRKTKDPNARESDLANIPASPLTDFVNMNKEKVGGYCAEKDFPFDAVANSTGQQQMTRSLEDFFAAAKSGKLTAASDNLCKMEASTVMALLPQKKNLTQILNAVSGANPNDVLQRLDHLACEGRRIKGNKIPEMTYIQSAPNISGAALTKRMDAALALKQPAMVTFNFGDYTTLRSPVRHSVILVGRQWNQKLQECDYVFRNSWGANPPYEGSAVGDHGNFSLGQGEIESSAFEVETTKQAAGEK